MSILNRIARSHRLVVTACSGLVSRDEIVASIRELRERQDFDPDFRQLIDLSEVARLELSFADLEAILRLHDPFSNKGRRAVVAPGERGANFGVARMYQSLVDDENFEVFDSLLDAMTWLGVEGIILQKSRKQSTKQEQVPAQPTPEVPRSQQAGDSTDFPANRKRGTSG